MSASPATADASVHLADSSGWPRTHFPMPTGLGPAAGPRGALPRHFSGQTSLCTIGRVRVADRPWFWAETTLSYRSTSKRNPQPPSQQP